MGFFRKSQKYLGIWNRECEGQECHNSGSGSFVPCFSSVQAAVRLEKWTRKKENREKHKDVTGLIVNNDQGSQYTSHVYYDMRCLRPFRSDRQARHKDVLFSQVKGFSGLPLPANHAERTIHMSFRVPVSRGFASSSQGFAVS
jgi:hypothetical protein